MRAGLLQGVDEAQRGSLGVFGHGGRDCILDVLVGLSTGAQLRRNLAQCAETSCAQWQQFVVCPSQAVARRSRADRDRPILAAPVTAVRRVKAFFVSQKVNGRNAP